MNKAFVYPFKEVTPVFLWNYNCKKFIVINQGGSSSSKTYSIMQVFCLRASILRNNIFTVAGRHRTKLTEGALQDVKNIVRENPTIKASLKGGDWDKAFNGSSYTLTFKTGSYIKFASYKDIGAVKSAGKKDFLYLNEATEFSFEIYKQLETRVKKQIYIDYNPTARFWVHEKLLNAPTQSERDRIQLFISTLFHNTAISKEEKEKIIISNQTENLYRVYVRGLTGKTKEIIYNYNTITRWPNFVERIGYGLDFGFSDPLTIIKGGLSNGKAVFEEILYETQLKPDDIKRRMNQLKIPRYSLIFADNSRPEIIQYLQQGPDGFPNLVASEKPSVAGSIQFLKKFEPFSVLVNSPNFIDELQRYKFKKDRRTGKILEVPADNQDDHGPDAARYLAVSLWQNLIPPKQQKRKSKSV